MPTSTATDKDTPAGEDAPATGFKPLPQVANSGRLIKYLGTSDIRRLEVGENLLNTQPIGLQTTVEWTTDRNHVINTADYPDVPDAFWNQLVTYDTFQDITNLQPHEVPKSDWEAIYRPQG